MEKFMKLDENKRNRILNAAMKEFRYGYKKASTDAIVKEAGISKGLLFHYFGTKEQLFAFLARYAIDLLQHDYLNMLSKHKDILEGLWQMVLLKKDIVQQHPFLYDFVNGLWVHMDDNPSAEIAKEFEQSHQLCAQFHDQYDADMFRDDIDQKKAIEIISCTLDGFIMEAETKAISAGGWGEETYEQFLDDLRGYIEIFRLCFYKKEN